MQLEPWQIGMIATAVSGLIAWMTRIAVGISRLERLIDDVHEIREDVSEIRGDIVELDRRVTRIEPRPKPHAT